MRGSTERTVTATLADTGLGVHAGQVDRGDERVGHGRHIRRGVVADLRDRRDRRRGRSRGLADDVDLDGAGERLRVLRQDDAAIEQHGQARRCELQWPVVDDDPRRLGSRRRLDGVRALGIVVARVASLGVLGRSAVGAACDAPEVAQSRRPAGRAGGIAARPPGEARTVGRGPDRAASGWPGRAEARSGCGRSGSAPRG